MLKDRMPQAAARFLMGASLTALALPLAAPAMAQSRGTIETVTVTARLRAEDLQTVPVSVSAVDASALSSNLINNISQISQLVPSLNYNSPNPRNTSFTIRGLGSSVLAIAQSNDGLESGVGFYVDGVYHGRPATAAFDFMDIERVEVLRGPQGTVFGKNTTAGAISVVTKAPSFDTDILGEVSAGDFGYYQLKGTMTGALVDDLVAGRVSFAMTKRRGNLYNTIVGGTENTIGNMAIRGEVLYQPTSDFHFRLGADYSEFNDRCCTQVYVINGATLKAAARQYPSMATALGYNPPSLNPYDRKTDIDAALKVATDEGGVNANADWNLGAVTLTSITAWRWWNWDAANDRDYTSLSIQTQQHIPSYQNQFSQELRIASNDKAVVEYVAGLYWFQQRITGHPITVYGSQASFWLLGPAPTTPANLLDGDGSFGDTKFTSSSYAAFGEATWHVTDTIALTGGVRYTYEDKYGSYATAVSGGLATASTTLINMKLSILRPQSYTARVSNGSPSGRAAISWQATDEIMAYASYARGSKSGGINMSGLPLNPSNLPALSTAVIKPEQNTTIEVGVKTKLFDDHLLVNFDAFNTQVQDFQTNIVDTAPGALRGYLANIPGVRSQGFELDSNLVLENYSGHLSGAYTAGKYTSYAQGPCALENIAASTTVCNLTGRPLSGLPQWVISAGGEYSHPVSFFGVDASAYLHGEITYRSKTYGDPSDSKYTLLPGYEISNLTVGMRAGDQWDFSIWVHNLFNENYLQNVTVQAGNSGLVIGTPGDTRMGGVTARVSF